MDGFVADVGRLPRAVGSDPAFQAGELWSNPNALMRFQMQQSPLDSEVWLACGWRGPYLRMPAGTTALNDGWGRPFVILTTDVSGVPTPATAGQDIMGLASLGSDNAVGMSATGPAAWSKDLMASFYDVEGTMNPHWLANVQVRVWQRSELGDKIPPTDSGTLVVRLFLPNPSTGAIASIDSTPLPGPFSTIPVVSFPQIPIGPKVLRAYWTLADSSVRKSQPLPIQVTRTGAVNWELVLPYVAPAPAPTPTP